MATKIVVAIPVRAIEMAEKAIASGISDGKEGEERDDTYSGGESK